MGDTRETRQFNIRKSSLSEEQLHQTTLTLHIKQFSDWPSSAQTQCLQQEILLPLLKIYKL